MNKKFSIRNMIPLFTALAVVLIAVPVRTAQYLKIIDATTGFYNTIDASVYVLYIILAIGLFVGLIAPFIKHKSINPAPISVKSAGYTVVSLVMAVTLIIDSASQLMDYFDMFTTELAMGQTINEYVASQGGTLLMLQAVFGGLSAVYFFVTGVTIGLGNTDSSKFKLFALVPVLWCIVKLLYRFKRTISFVNVSDLLFELFLIVFAMMFFFAAAQVNSKIDAQAKDKELVQSVFWKIFGYGIPAAIFAVVCFLPKLILVISGNSDHINSHYPLSFSDFGFAVFAVYTCITALKAKEKAIEE